MSEEKISLEERIALARGNGGETCRGIPAASLPLAQFLEAAAYRSGCRRFAWQFKSLFDPIRERELTHSKHPKVYGIRREIFHDSPASDDLSFMVAVLFFASDTQNIADDDFNELLYELVVEPFLAPDRAHDAGPEPSGTGTAR